MLMAAIIAAAIALGMLVAVPARGFGTNNELSRTLDHAAMRDDLMREREMLLPRCMNETEIDARVACAAMLRVIEDALRALEKGGR